MKLAKSFWLITKHCTTHVATLLGHSFHDGFQALREHKAHHDARHAPVTSFLQILVADQAVIFTKDNFL